MVGNLLLGETAKQSFLTTAMPSEIAAPDKATSYAHLADVSAQGEQPGSSAGGEQPKFTAYAHTAQGSQHVIVKFSQAHDSPNSQRWRDLLMAEHLALQTLLSAGVAAAHTQVIDTAQQRFLEVQRFDRVGALGRKALYSLAALDAEFVGMAHQPWPMLTQPLVKQGVITAHAAQQTQLLWAFGALIGNTDMHHGNLSFIAEQGRPFELAPAYDMTPMAFAPTSSGWLPNQIAPIAVASHVSPAHWRTALSMAQAFIEALTQHNGWSDEFQPCLQALLTHLNHCAGQIRRLA
jgi:hypothetical protein